MVEGELSGDQYNIWFMKEPDYLCKMFGTAGRLHVMNVHEHTRICTEGGIQKKSCFKYNEPFALHFKYFYVVDNHNNIHHQIPSIKESWQTVHWSHRVFAFLIVVTEIDVYLTMWHFVLEGEEFLSLIYIQHKLAWELINNKYCKMEETALRQSKGKNCQKCAYFGNGAFVCKTLDWYILEYNCPN